MWFSICSSAVVTVRFVSIWEDFANLQRLISHTQSDVFKILLSVFAKQESVFQDYDGREWHLLQIMLSVVLVLFLKPIYLELYPS